MTEPLQPEEATKWIYISPEDSERARGFWTPERTRYHRLKQRLARLSRARAKPLLEKAILRCWNRLVDALLEVERLDLPPVHRGKNEGRYLRMGWVVLEDATLNETSHFDRFSVHPENEPLTLKPTLRAVLERTKGVWEIPREMFLALWNHPSLLKLGAQSRGQFLKRTAKEEVHQAMLLQWGPMLTPSAGGDLNDALNKPLIPWLQNAQVDPRFWEILWKAVKLGKEIGRDEVMEAAETAIRQGIAMEAAGTGKGPDLLTTKLEDLLRGKFESGLQKPKPTSVLAEMGLQRPKLSLDQFLNCPSDPPLNRLLTQKGITFSKFQGRVKDLGKKIWGI